MEKISPELLAELRTEAQQFARQVGVKSCDQDCEMCWMYRSDVPCPQRYIIDAHIAGAILALRKQQKSVILLSDPLENGQK